MITSRKISLLASVWLLTTTNFNSALAEGHRNFDQDNETVSVRVKAGDLDLSTKEGARELLRRIRGAAVAACFSPADQLYQHYGMNPCVKEATDRAVFRLNQPVVSAMNINSNPANASLASVHSNNVLK